MGLAMFGVLLALTATGRFVLHELWPAPWLNGRWVWYSGALYALPVFCAFGPLAYGIPSTSPLGFWAGGVLIVGVSWWILHALERRIPAVTSIAFEVMPLFVVFLLISSMPLIIPAYWTWRSGYDAFIATVVADDVVPDACPQEATFAHASDAHIALGQQTMDREVPGNELIAPLLQRLHKMKVQVLLLSGDTTDTGQEEEWSVASEALGKADGIRLVIAPGNHDISSAYAPPTNVLPDQGILARWVSYFRNAAAIMPAATTFDGVPMRDVAVRIESERKNVAAWTKEQSAACGGVAQGMGRPITLQGPIPTWGSASAMKPACRM